jgi:hypothetical protein
MQPDKIGIFPDRKILEDWEISCLRDRGMTNSEVRKWELPLSCEIGSVDGTSVYILDLDGDEEEGETSAHDIMATVKAKPDNLSNIPRRRNRFRRHRSPKPAYSSSQDDNDETLSLLTELENDIKIFQPHTVPADLKAPPRLDSFDFHNEQKDFLVPPLRYSLFPKTGRSSNGSSSSSNKGDAADFEEFKRNLPLNVFNFPPNVNPRSHRFASVDGSGLSAPSHLPEQWERGVTSEKYRLPKETTKKQRRGKWLSWYK